jgi:hypothetical protein
MNPNERKLQRKVGGLLRLDFGPQQGEFLSQRLIIFRHQAVGRLLAGGRSVRKRTAYENPEIISRRD